MAEREDEKRYAREVHEQAAADAVAQIKGPCGQAVAKMAREGRAVQMVGRVVDGKFEIDRGALDEFASRFPNANATFIAVNAPFDPTFSATLLEA